MANVTIIGAGFVGDAVGFGLMNKGHKVVMHDVNRQRLVDLQSQGFVVEADLEVAVMAAEFIFIQVPTPSTKDGIDLSFVNKVVADLKILLTRTGKKYVILKSTVLPGTTRRIAAELEGLAHVCFCPEFLQEKTARFDFLHPDRIVLGGPSEVTRMVAGLFERFKAPIVCGEYESAEMCKYASNLWFAANISYWNDVVKMSNCVGAVPDEVHKMVMPGQFFGEHPWRIGQPFGGHCLPKDIRALLCFADSRGVELKVIRAVEDVNVEVGGERYE